LPSDDNAVVDESAKKTRVEPAPAPVSVDFPRGKASSHAGSAAAATTANSSTGHESENLFTIRDDADRAVAKRKKAKKAANKEKEKKENAIKRAKVEEDVRSDSDLNIFVVISQMDLCFLSFAERNSSICGNIEFQQAQGWHASVGCCS
jgi:hypothetical protein